MAVALYLTAIMSGFGFKRSRFVTAYIFIVMLLLAAFRTSGADLQSYIYEYGHAFETNNSVGRYIGYKYIIRFFNILGLSFTEYMFVIYSISFLLLIAAINMISININTILALYLIFPFGIDVIQMKSFLAEIVAFWGLAFWLRGQTIDMRPIKKRLYAVCYILIELLAALIHFSFLYFVFVGFFLFIFKQEDKIKRWIFRGIIVIVPAVYFGIVEFIIQSAIKLGIIGGYDSVYMEQFYSIRTRFGALIPSLWVLLMIYFVNHYRKIDKSKVNITGREELETVLKKFVLTSAILIPFFLIYIYFSRLLRIYMLIAYIIYFNKKNNVKISGISLSASKIAFIGAFIIGYWLDLFSVFHSTLASLLTNNLIL